MPRVVLDAGIVAKWVLNEKDSAEARRLLQDLAARRAEIFAPAVLPSELTYVFYQLSQRNLMTPESAGTVLKDLLGQVAVVVPPAGLYERALVIAAELDLDTSYIAEYIALAEQLDAEFWTADLSLYELASPRYPFVRSLREHVAMANK